MLFPETVLLEEPESEMPSPLFVMLFPEMLLFKEELRRMPSAFRVMLAPDTSPLVTLKSEMPWYPPSIHPSWIKTFLMMKCALV